MQRVLLTRPMVRTAGALRQRQPPLRLRLRDPSRSALRTFSAPPARADQQSPDWVRLSIQKLLEQTEHASSGSNASNNTSSSSSSSNTQPRALAKSLAELQHRLQEAQLCVNDCQECTDEAERQSEIAAAEIAVDEAVGCFADILDDLRAAVSSSSSSSNTGSADGDESPPPYSTEELARCIKSLRADIEALKSAAGTKAKQQV